MIPLFSPTGGRALTHDTPHSLEDGTGERWPVVDDIPYLRTDSEGLVAVALDHLDAGCPDDALVALLTDQDAWWTGPATDLTELKRLVRERDTLSLRDAMALLRMGPVADYFAFRWSDPTYLAGLALLEAHWDDPATAFEPACGIGHYLRELTARGVACTGADVVFSKCWLAKHWVAPDAEYLVFDAAAPYPIAGATFDLVMCHDAFYFLPDQIANAERLRALTASNGVLAVSHVHNAGYRGGAKGPAKTADDWATLFPTATVYDEARLLAALMERTTPSPTGWHADDGIEAWSLAEGGPAARAVDGGVAMPRADAVLRSNPLLGREGARWPSDRYRADPPPRRSAGALVMTAARWAIAGFGWVARDYMYPAIEAAGGTLVAVADPSPIAQASAESAGIVAYDDVATMLGGTECDILYVATPNNLHAPAVLAAISAGVPVLCEKPMAASLADAERIAAAVAGSATLYGAAFDQRHHPAHRAMRDRIADGAIGTPTAVRIVYACWVDPLWSPNGDAADNWRADPEAAGGGAVIDLALHGLDLAEMLLGEPIETLSITLQRRIHDYPVDDGGVLIGRTASGVLVSLHVAYNHPEALPRRRLEVVGDAGLLTATNTMGQSAGGACTLTDATGADTPVRFDETLSPFVAQARAFAAAAAGEPHDYSATRDIRLMRVFDAAYRDARACL